MSDYDGVFVTREEFQQLVERANKSENRLTKLETNVYNMDQRLARIDNNTSWVLRLVLGVIIMALLYNTVGIPKALPVGTLTGGETIWMNFLL